MATKRKTSSRRIRSSSKLRRSSGKRDLVKPRTANFYAKRTTRGRFREMDEQGRSLAVEDFRASHAAASATAAASSSTGGMFAPAIEPHAARPDTLLLRRELTPLADAARQRADEDR